MHKFAKKRQSKRTLSIRQDTAFHAFPTFHVFSPVYCSQDPHVLFSQKFSLKLGLTILFTHLKIILLQYFQFSAISSIQTNPQFLIQRYNLFFFQFFSLPISTCLSYNLQFFFFPFNLFNQWVGFIHYFCLEFHIGF